MGNHGAKIFGLEEAEITPAESVAGVSKVVGACSICVLQVLKLNYRLKRPQDPSHLGVLSCILGRNAHGRGRRQNYCC